MPQAKDYLAMRTVSKDDKLDFGIKGMQWGVRRDRATLRSASAKKTESGSKVATKTTEPASSGSTHKAPYEGETSSARYARLQNQAKAGKVSDMSEPDLKFFNSRTEAIAKVNKMYEKKPNWVAEAAKEAGKAAVKQTMNQVAKGVAEKYIGGPILDAVTGGKGAEAAAAAGIAKSGLTSAVGQVKAASNPSAPTISSLASRARSAAASRQAEQERKYGPKRSGLGYIERGNTSYPAKS